MPEQLVTTKLRAPRMRPNLVSRPRLREAMDRNEGRRLTLVSAPAGFGKTTLLGDWLETRLRAGDAVAWLSLDGSDNDPARFLAYLVKALQEVEAGIGEGVLASLRSPEDPPVEIVAGALVNDLSEVPREVSLILDDYHLIDADPAHHALSYLIEHLPDNVHLLIASRTDPPLPLPRLRARNQIIELRAADLRFTPEEATAFLNHTMGLSLSRADIAALGDVTEGWVAALQLAALSMQGRDDISGFVESFSGSNRYVLDFLAEEVLERQSEAVKAFLLETSVLERMKASLCDAVTGRDDGQAMLERLERENLFVVGLDDERGWYRYHHLFAAFLLGRLGSDEPELVGELHLRASAWYEENGLISEAIGHALCAGDTDADYERAARLIEGEAKLAWGTGEGPAVLRWLERLPEAAARRRPRLLLEHAMALSLTGRPADAEPLLAEAERLAETTPDDLRYLQGFASAIRCVCERLRGDAAKAVEAGRRALSLLPEEESPHRNFAAVVLGDALRITGDLEGSLEAFREAVVIGQTVGHAYGTLAGMVWHARVQSERGRLGAAEDELRQALDFVRDQGVEALPAAGLAHVGMGILLYERDELDGAERELTRGVELAERAREVSNVVRGYVTLSRVMRARGDGARARELAREAYAAALDAGAGPELSIAVSWMTRLHLALGDLPAAVALQQESPPEDAPPLDGTHVVDRLTRARLTLAQGRHEQALNILNTLHESAEATERTDRIIEILSLRALALWASNKKERALEALTEALALAEPEGYVRTFADEGAPMGELLSALLQSRHGVRAGAADRLSTGYLANLLTVLAREGASSAGEGIGEPLSERELEVLALVAAGDSNGQIAGKLFVSTSTVKTHINNLYRKLDAHSRTGAVARAREAGIL